MLLDKERKTKERDNFWYRMYRMGRVSNIRLYWSMTTKNRQISHLCIPFLKQPSISHSPMKSGIWENILLTKTLPLASMTIICKWQIITFTTLVIRSVEQGWSQFQSIQKENLIPIPNVPHWKTIKSIGIGIQWTAWIDWKLNVIYSNPEVVIRVTDWLTYRGLWSHQGYRS